MDWKVLSLVITLGAAAAYMVLERIFPYEKGQKLFRKGFWTDTLFYGIAQSLALGAIIDVLIRWIDATSGLSRLQLVSDWPLWAQLLFFFVVHDFYIYWFHRWQHHNEVLWRVHEAHHSVEDIDWMAGTRSHSLEILINQTIEFAPIVLLGAAPEVAPMKATLDAVWGMYIHSNLNVRMGPVQYLFNGPEMHRWHHAGELGAPGVNFSTKIALWDWLFGTAFLPTDRRPRFYGLGDPSYPIAEKAGFWGAAGSQAANYFRQHVHAFRPFEKPAASAAQDAE